MDYIFVACLREFGSVTLEQDGNKWIVNTSGVWIPDIFSRDDRFLNIEKERYCFKKRSTIKQRPVFLINPSFDDLENMPEN